jgi:hypothetical protein
MSLRWQVESLVSISICILSSSFLGGSSDGLEDVQSPLLVIQLRQFGLSYLNFILSSTQNLLTDISNLDTAQSQNVTSECPMNFECQLNLV